MREALADRGERHEADPELFQEGQDLGLGLAPPQGVFALKGRDWLHGVCATDRVGPRLRHAEVADLPGRDQVSHRARDVLHRHVRIDAVLVEKVDDVGAQALERLVTNLPDALGPAVEPVGRDAVLEAELGGDDHLVSHRFECLAHDLLVEAWTVSLSRIEEGHPALDGGADERDGLMPVGGGPVAEAQAHATETEGGDFEATSAKHSFLHAKTSLGGLGVRAQR